MTSIQHSADTQNAKLAVADLQRQWILEGWEKQPGEHWTFDGKVGHFYDWDNSATSLHDTFDPQLRVARSPKEWADAFEPSFAGMNSALHAVTDEPDVLVSGDIASATFEFCVRLEAGDSKVTGAICRTSHVWGFKNGKWTIIREHTSCRVASVQEVQALLGKFEPQKL
ncbi:nuclear transport factor 2 family protein [Devosia riboflavina]